MFVVLLVRSFWTSHRLGRVSVPPVGKLCTVLLDAVRAVNSSVRTSHPWRHLCAPPGNRADATGNCSRGGQLQLRQSRPTCSKTDDGKISVSNFVLPLFPFFFAVLAKAIGVHTAIRDDTVEDTPFVKITIVTCPPRRPQPVLESHGSRRPEGVLKRRDTLLDASGRGTTDVSSLWRGHLC